MFHIPVLYKSFVIIHSGCVDPFQAIHGTLKTIEGPPNLGIHLPLSTKPTNSNSANSNSPSNNNNKKDGGNVSGQDKGEKRRSPSPMKKTNSNCSADLKNPPGSGYTCRDCSGLFSSREDFVAHMRREHGKVNVWNHSHKEVSDNYLRFCLGMVRETNLERWYCKSNSSGRSIQGWRFFVMCTTITGVVVGKENLRPHWNVVKVSKVYYIHTQCRTMSTIVHCIISIQYERFYIRLQLIVFIIDNYVDYFLY